MLRRCSQCRQQEYDSLYADECQVEWGGDEYEDGVILISDNVSDEFAEPEYRREVRPTAARLAHRPEENQLHGHDPHGDEASPRKMARTDSARAGKWAAFLTGNADNDSAMGATAQPGCVTAPAGRPRPQRVGAAVVRECGVEGAACEEAGEAIGNAHTLQTEDAADGDMVLRKDLALYFGSERASRAPCVHSRTAAAAGPDGRGHTQAAAGARCLLYSLNPES